MKIALVQMEIQERNKAKNVAHGLELIKKASLKNDVVVLPEIWSTGYSLGKLQEEAEPEESKLVEEICAVAKANNCNIVAGSLPRRINGKIYNNTLVINREGKIVNSYSKMHLFGLFHEEKFFAPGEDCQTFALDDVSCGSAICYDLRFPELFRHLALKGAQIIFLPAEWPSPRGDVWRLLNQARAVEDHIFVVAVNCAGYFKEEKFFGHSMIVSPSGKIVVEAGEEEEILEGEIDLKEIATVREKINVLSDIRKEFFPEK